MQWSLSITVTQPGISPIFDEKFHHRHMSRVCCSMQRWCPAWPSLSIHICSPLKKQTTSIFMATATSVMLKRWMAKSLQHGLIINFQKCKWAYAMSPVLIPPQGCALMAPGHPRQLTFSFRQVRKDSRSLGQALSLLVQCLVKQAKNLTYWCWLVESEFTELHRKCFLYETNKRALMFKGRSAWFHT